MLPFLGVGASDVPTAVIHHPDTDAKHRLRERLSEEALRRLIRDFVEKRPLDGDDGARSMKAEL